MAIQVVPSTGLTQFDLTWSGEQGPAAAASSQMRWQLHLHRHPLDTLYRLFVVVVTAVLSVGVYFTLQNAKDQTGAFTVSTTAWKAVELHEPRPRDSKNPGRQKSPKQPDLPEEKVSELGAVRSLKSGPVGSVTVAMRP